jgi:hypothetical protein
MFYMYVRSVNWMLLILTVIVSFPCMALAVIQYRENIGGSTTSLDMKGLTAAAKISLDKNSFQGYTANIENVGN